MGIQVPEFEEQVQQQPISGGRLSVGADETAFGGGPTAAAATAAAQGVSDDVFRMANNERQRANQVAVLAADNQLSKLETSIMYAPKNSDGTGGGVLTKRGKDVLGLPEQVFGDYKKGSDAIAATLANEEQRISFSQMANSRQYTLERLVQRHVDGQMREYDQQVTDSALKNARSEAILNWDDPAHVEQMIEKQKAAIVDHATGNGMPAEWVKRMSQEAESATRAGVIKQMLTSNQDILAKSYFEAHKDGFTGDDIAHVETVLKEGSLRGEAQRQSDEIILGGNNTNGAKDRGDALEKARDIDNPEVRDQVEARINKYYSEQKEAEHERQVDLYQKAALLVDSNPNKPVRELIDPTTWTGMSPEQRDALQRRAENPPNDDKAWLNFLDLSSRPAQLAKLSRADFETQYWANFDRTHRDRAEGLYRAAQEGKAQSAALASTLSFNQRIDTTLRTSGIIPANKEKSKFSADQATTYAQIEQKAASEIEQFELTELGGKRKATGDEMQKIIDGIVTKQVFVHNANPFSSDQKKISALLSVDERNRAYVPVAKIPTPSRNSLENMMRAQGRKITNDKLQRAYGATLSGDAERLRQIISE